MRSRFGLGLKTLLATAVLICIALQTARAQDEAAGDQLLLELRQVRTEVERGMFDIESIEKANNDLIDTINESIEIYEEGKKKRADAEKRLKKTEADLRERLKSLKN